MQKIIAALALVSLAGCALSPGSLVLVFPSDQDKANAAHATIIEVRPMSATDDQCPRYLQFAEPDPNQIESSTTLDLNNGVPSQEIKHVPNGYQTLLVKVTNAQTNLILHGCRSGDVGGKFEIDLVDVNQAPPDLSPNGDGAVDLLPPPNDMTMHKYLQITATEMRLSTRKLSGVVITLKDSGTSTQTLPPTDSTGTVKIDTLGMTPPFTITASAPVSNGYQGASTLTGVNPT
ncbi:MAG TPA: hypothetical protein VFF06_05750, partial [Polyangia bacterium]|nr:hypothetical protein [Polyangia bacterium]